MRTPKFWNTRNVFSLLLLPASAVYGALSWLRFHLTPPVKLDIPVICVGNITAGGAGKTPVAIALGEWCKARNINAFFLSRGYGGTQKTPLLVSPDMSADLVGDEPLLLAQTLPTIVSCDRVKGAKLAIERGAKLIIMDDGFQNPALQKDISFLVVNANYGLGNGYLLPAGPLREPVKHALKRAHAIVAINGLLPALKGSDLPVFHAYAKTDAEKFAGKRMLGFAGIAHPEAFLQSLQEAGVGVAAFRGFSDHHRFTKTEMERLKSESQKLHAPLVTTCKDAVRLPPALRSQVETVQLSLHFNDVAAFEKFMEQALA